MCHCLRPHTAVRLHVTSKHCTYATMQDGTGITPSESIAARQVLPSLQQQLRKELIDGGIDPDAAALVCLQPGSHCLLNLLYACCVALPRPDKCCFFMPQLHSACRGCRTLGLHACHEEHTSSAHLSIRTGIAKQSFEDSSATDAVLCSLLLNPISFGVLSATHHACKVPKHAQCSRCSSSSMYSLAVLL